jgi:RNA polymerase I-specific transcription initiation factor RRN7
MAAKRFMVMQIICRDLWALHLSLLPSPPPPEPLLHKQATYGHPSDGRSKSADPKKSKSNTTADDEKAVEILPGQSHANTSESDDSEEGSETDELLFLLSETSSSEDDKDDDDSRQPRPKPKSSGQKVDTFVRNGPASNVALLMVACWTLRLPIIYMDLIRFDDGIE